MSGENKDKKRNFRDVIKTVFKKEDPAYDDGYGYDDRTVDDGKSHFMNLVMAIYGTVAGFFACQYVKYLHQRYACNAWGIPLTSHYVEPYGLPQVVVDICAFGVIYFFALALGVLLNRILMIYLDDKMANAKEVANIGLAYGFAFLTIVSILMFFVRFNIFLIGID